ncbi:MAG TPA: aldo/keto reductase [Solirubrobacterales bacterium]|nr:aldo/keto reductase [Solirubrobacterales bacterium]
MAEAAANSMEAAPDPAASVQVGSTGLTVSRLAIGTNPLGNLYAPLEDSAAEEMLAAAYGAGVRYFDTAPLYGYGLAEERLGRALAGLPRDSLTISTKVGRTLGSGSPPPEPGGVLVRSDGTHLFQDAPARYPSFDYSEEGVRRSLTESLERLGLDRVDIVYIHDPDDHWEEAIGGAYPALARLRDEGVVTAIGAGMNQAEMLARFVRETDLDCLLLAGRYSLLDQGAAEELFPACQARGVSVVLGGVYNGGILADPGLGMYDYLPADQGIRTRVAAIAEICRRHDVPLAAAALRFAYRHPAVTSVVLGVRSADELEENLRHMSSPIPQSLWDDLATAGVKQTDGDPNHPRSAEQERE